MRFVESRLGASCGVLLAALWLAGLATGGSLAYMAFPCCVLLVPLVLAALLGLARGDRFVRPGVWPWSCMAVAGGYFMTRCWMSYSAFDAMNESSILLCGLVFYVAGLFIAPARGKPDLIMRVLVGTIVLQVGAMLALPAGLAPLWTGKCPVALDAGASVCPGSFFIYKNFAAQFNVALGLAALTYAWIVRGRAGVWLAVAGVASLAAAFCLPSRSGWLLVPAGIAVAWFAYFAACEALKRRVGWLYVTFTVLGLIAVGCCFIVALQHGIPASVGQVLNSHERLQIANYAASVPREGAVYWFGSGARTFLWEVLPFFRWGRFLPNYAHNEYLQAQMDYGVTGLTLMIAVLLGHIVFGARRLTLVRKPEEAAVTAAALVVVCLVALHACVEFVWHHVTIVSLTAFCLGVIAAPCPTPRSSLKALGASGRAVLALLAFAVMLAASWLAVQLAPGWLGQWRYAQSVADKEPLERQMEILGDIVERYPDPAVVDFYAKQMARTAPGVPAMERVQSLLGRAESMNPRHVFNAYTRASYLDALGRHEEAEATLRRMSADGGVQSLQTYSWRALYAMHLASWGRRLLAESGPKGRARSLLQYAENILANAGFETGDPWGMKERLIAMTPQEQKNYRAALRNDLHLLEELSVSPDPSWKQALEEGVQGALYPELGDSALRSR